MIQSTKHRAAGWLRTLALGVLQAALVATILLIVLISDDGDGSRIEGNFIGTDPTGMADLGNGAYGVGISGASQVTVGGGSPDARNLISGNDRNGVDISGDGSQNLVQGNYIGTTRAGAGALGNSNWGVFIAGVSDNIVGGATKGRPTP